MVSFFLFFFFAHIYQTCFAEVLLLCGHKGSSHLSPVFTFHIYRALGPALTQLADYLAFAYSRSGAFRSGDTKQKSAFLPTLPGFEPGSSARWAVGRQLSGVCGIHKYILAYRDGCCFPTHGGRGCLAHEAEIQRVAGCRPPGWWGWHGWRGWCRPRVAVCIWVRNVSGLQLVGERCCLYRASFHVPSTGGVSWFPVRAALCGGAAPRRRSRRRHGRSSVRWRRGVAAATYS